MVGDKEEIGAWYHHGSGWLTMGYPVYHRVFGVSFKARWGRCSWDINGVVVHEEE